MIKNHFYNILTVFSVLLVYHICGEAAMYQVGLLFMALQIGIMMELSANSTKEKESSYGETTGL